MILVEWNAQKMLPQQYLTIERLVSECEAISSAQFERIFWEYSRMLETGLEMSNGSLYSLTPQH